MGGKNRKCKRIIMLVMFLVCLLAISAVSAAENVTDISVSEDYSSEVLDSSYDDNTFQPRIILEDYSYRQNIPQKINYLTYYGDYDGYYIMLLMNMVIIF